MAIAEELRDLAKDLRAIAQRADTLAAAVDAAGTRGYPDPRTPVKRTRDR